MRVFFDTEFTGLYKDTSLISIGCISEDRQKFYAELTDFNKTAVETDVWIQKNVFKNTFFVNADGSRKQEKERLDHIDQIIDIAKGDDALFGSRSFVSKALRDWLSGLKKDVTEIEFVSDVCHYDMVLLIDLLSDGGTAFDIPNFVCPCSYDINQDISTYYLCNQKDAFNKSREDIVKDIDSIFFQVYPENLKHNALYDAIVIQKIYERIHGITKEDIKV